MSFKAEKVGDTSGDTPPEIGDTFGDTSGHTQSMPIEQVLRRGHVWGHTALVSPRSCVSMGTHTGHRTGKESE